MPVVNQDRDLNRDRLHGQPQPELTYEERLNLVKLENRRTYVNGLRAAADFYEQHVDVKLPGDTGINNYIVNTKEDARVIIKALGSCKKKYDDVYFHISKEISPGFTLRFVLTRDNVCEKVQVGTKSVPEHVIPAEPAREEKVVLAREEPIWEYRCPSILASDDSQDGR